MSVPSTRAEHPWVSVSWPGPITDAHMHVGSMPMFGVDLDIQEFGQHLADNGISTALAIGADSAGNEAVAQAVTKIPEAFGLVWVNPKQPDAVDEACHYLTSPELGGKFRGLKLHPLLDGYPPDDPSVFPLAELALEYGVPVLMHCGHAPFSLPWQIEKLAARYPELPVVMAHMGHGTITYIDAAIDAAERHPNISLETSGMPMGCKIAEAVHRLGAEKVMYGSDSPCHHPLAEQVKVLASGLPEEDLAMVMHGSAQRVFFPAGTRM
jgi:uncharacterized protein